MGVRPCQALDISLRRDYLVGRASQERGEMKGSLNSQGETRGFLVTQNNVQMARDRRATMRYVPLTFSLYMCEAEGSSSCLGP